VVARIVWRADSVRMLEIRMALVTGASKRIERACADGMRTPFGNRDSSVGTLMTRVAWRLAMLGSRPFFRRLS